MPLASRSGVQRLHERPDPAAERSERVRKLVLFGFFVVMLLSVAANLWRFAGVPVRSAALMGFLGLLALYDQAAVVRILRIHKNTVVLTLLFAILGGGVSLLNGLSLPKTILQVLEIHIQSVVTLIATALVMEICGVALTAAVFVGVMLITGVFAMGQFLGINAFWMVRETLAQVFNEPSDLFSRARAVGLSMSTIALATQMCLGVAAVGVYRQRACEARGAPREFDLSVVFWVGVFVFACLASGNRSPMLGCAIFLALYALRAPRILLFTAPFVVLAIPLVPIVFNLLQGTGLRAFETGDKSSEGRAALQYYGFLLLKDHPIGYGLDFDPTRYWGQYWQFIREMPNPATIRVYPLHNYPLTMMNMYGIGILALIPFAILIMMRNSSVILPFIPYLLHIAFHNYGPYYNDPLVFAVFALATQAAYAPLAKAHAAEAQVPSRWRPSVLRARS